MAEEKKETEKKKKKAPGWIKYLLIGLIAVALLAAAGVAGFMLNSSDLLGNLRKKKETSSSGVNSSGESSGAIAFQVGPMLDIDSFIVNILDEEGTHYLKAAITLELDKPGTLTEINQRMPQIRDKILLQVGNKTFRELADLEGKMQLRAELVSSLNQIIETGEVKKIFFTDFVVQ